MNAEIEISPYPGEPHIGFSGSPLDRLGHQRMDEQWLSQQRAHPDARFVIVWRDMQPLDRSGARYLSSDELPEDLADTVFLGCADDRPYFAVDASMLDEGAVRDLSQPARLRDLRGAAPHLPTEDAAILAYARGMVYWQRQHRHCGRCGHATRATQGGHVLRCDTCEVEHYPRSDPSMLVLVTSGDRCLLGRQPQWPPAMWSTLAGFVEPGERVEDTVVREVWEEARIRVTGMTYFASQPWPFPASVLFGFHAEGVPDEPAVEQDELEAAGWFDRAWIAEGLARHELMLPPPVTLSHRLIEHWFNRGWERPLQELMLPY